MENVPITLKINKSNQMTLPVAVKKFLGIDGAGEVVATMREGGILEIKRERTPIEVRESIFAKMSPLEKRRVKKRIKMMKEAFPDRDDYLEAEKNWRDLPWNQKAMKKEAKKYGIKK